MSVSFTGRLYARRASVERIRRAHPTSLASFSGELRRDLAEAVAEAGAVSSAVDGPASPKPLAEAGRQTKMRRRLGESPPPVALYGPLIVTLLIAGCVPR